MVYTFYRMYVMMHYQWCAHYEAVSVAVMMMMRDRTSGTVTESCLLQAHREARSMKRGTRSEGTQNLQP
jgi:hypothetical protein